MTFRNHWLARYVLVLMVVLAAFLLREGLVRMRGGNLPAYITFYPAVMLSALLGGVGPGLVATVTLALGADYFILPPQGSFRVATLADAVGLAFFTGMGVFMSVVAELYRRARQQTAPEAAALRPSAREVPTRWSRQGLLLNAGLAASLAIMAGAGWQSARNLRALAKADEMETHSRLIILELDRLISALKDAETGQRGYLLTAEEKYLEPYKASIGLVQSNLAGLTQLTRDDATQQQRLARLGAFILEKTGELKQTIELRRTQGLAAALEVVRTDKGKAIMDQIRQRVVDAQDDENRSLQRRSTAKSAEAGRTLQTLLAGGVLSVLLLVTVFLFLKQENVRRTKAEVEVRRHRDHLQEMVAARTEELSQANEKLKKEIKEHQQAREALRQQHEWLRVTLASIGDAVLATDTAGRITFLNPVAEALSGWPEHEALGQQVQNVFRIINEKTHAAGEDIVARVLREGQVIVLANHTALIARDGHQVPIEDSAAPIRGSSGTISGVVLVFHDVTQKRRAQEALRENQERLDLALISSRMATFEWDIVKDKRYWSSGVHSLLGTNPEAFTGTADEFFRVIHPEDRSVVEAALAAAVETTSVYETEYRAVWPDGSVHHIAARGRVHHDDTGRAVRMTAVCWDITERNRTEEAHARLAAIVESSDDAILSKNTDGTITSWNLGAVRMFGYRPEEVIGRSIKLLQPPDRQDEEDLIMARLQAGERVDHFETIRLTKEGRSLPVSVTISPLKDGVGRIIGASKIIHDISERKQKEEDLQKLNRALKALQESSQAMTRAESEAEYLDAVCKNLMASCGYAMVWIGFVEEDEARTVRPVAYAGFEEGYLETLKISWADNQRGRGPTGTAIRTGKPCSCRNMLTDAAFAPWRAEALKRGYASSLALPLISEGKTFGALTIYSRQPDPFPEDEIRLLAQLADDVSYCVRSLRSAAQRWRAEEQLRLLSTAVESAANGIVVTDRTAQILWTNPAFTKLTGYSRAEVVGQNPRILKSGLHSPEFYRQMWSTLLKGEPWHGEVVNRHKNGSLYPEEMTITPVQTETGEITHFVAIKQDVTARQRAERRRQLLAEAASRLLSSDDPQHDVAELCGKVLEFLDCQMFFNFLVDEKQALLHLNAWAGVPPLEAEKMEWFDCCNAMCGHAASVGCRMVVRNIQGTPDPRTDLVKPYGMEAYACHPLMVGGRFLGSLSFGTRTRTQFTEEELSLMKAMSDLVVSAIERKRSQKALQLTAEEVKRSNHDLEQFAYIASHDLQEPLRAVDGYVKLLRRRFPQNVDAKALEYINGAVEGAGRMERLINDLLEFSRVGTRGGSFSPADLNAVLDEALHNLQTSINSSQAIITRAALPTLAVDATQMMQLFQNLIGNALKFCGERTPEIFVGAQKEPGRWVFSIRDNGIGIEPQYFERIFQIFQRLHTRKHYPGTGIGLAICKKIVERHDGAIWIKSEPGQGATFYFSLPDTSSAKQS